MTTEVNKLPKRISVHGELIAELQGALEDDEESLDEAEE